MHEKSQKKKNAGKVDWRLLCWFCILVDITLVQKIQGKHLIIVYFQEKAFLRLFNILFGRSEAVSWSHAEHGREWMCILTFLPVNITHFSLNITYVYMVIVFEKPPESLLDTTAQDMATEYRLQLCIEHHKALKKTESGQVKYSYKEVLHFSVTSYVPVQQAKGVYSKIMLNEWLEHLSASTHFVTSTNAFWTSQHVVSDKIIHSVLLDKENKI